MIKKQKITKKLNILGIIPARGGSAGLKNKNIKLLLGKPTIYYTIKDAKESKLLDKIVCSTEDSRIARIVKKYNIEVIKRPKELASAKSRIEGALRHAVNTLEKKQKFRTDAVVLLFPCVPVRDHGIIDKTITEFLKTGADCVMTVQGVERFHPNWMLKLDKEKKVEPYSPVKIYRRQDLSDYYIDDGAVVVIKKEILMRNDGNPLFPAFGNNIRAIIQDSQDVVDIDSQHDYFLAEAILRARKLKAKKKNDSC